MNNVVAGYNNIAVGFSTGNGLATGHNNIAIGYDAIKKIVECEKCVVIFYSTISDNISYVADDYVFIPLCSSLGHEFSFFHFRSRPYTHYKCVHGDRLDKSLKICKKILPKWLELYRYFVLICGYEYRDIFLHVLDFYLLTLQP